MAKRHMLVVVAVLAATQVSAQNLLTNGSFDSDVTGWAEADDRAVWRGDMGNTLTGGSGPGAAEVRGEGSDCNGAVHLIAQTVPVSPGALMVARVAAFVPGGDNAAVGAGGFVYWESGSGDTVAISELTATSTGTEQWFWLEASSTVPEGVGQARFTFGVAMPGGGCSTPAVAVFDDAFLGRIAPDLFVPAAAATPGSNGTYWSTTLWALNPNPNFLRLEGAFLPAGRDNSSALAALTDLGIVQGGGTLEVTDVVSALGASGTGGIYLRAVDPATGELPPEGIQAVTYTFTPNPAGDGNFGQGIPAEEAGTAELVRAAGVRHDGAYRSNVGALNMSDQAITIEVSIVAQDGSIVGTRSWDLPPYGQWQESVRSIGVSSIGQGMAIFRRTSGTGGFVAYLSRVDNASGDAVYVPAR